MRKSVSLTATLYSINSNHALFNVTLTSLSASGLSFESNASGHLAVGGKLEIEFPLGDAGMIAREAITIKHLRDDGVGAEFVEAHYDPDSDIVCI